MNFWYFLVHIVLDFGSLPYNNAFLVTLIYLLSQDHADKLHVSLLVLLKCIPNELLINPRTKLINVLLCLGLQDITFSLSSQTMQNTL